MKNYIGILLTLGKIGEEMMKWRDDAEKLYTQTISLRPIVTENELGPS